MGKHGHGHERRRVVGRELAEGRLGFAIGGAIRKEHAEGNERVIDEFDLLEVSLVHTDAGPGEMDQYGAWGFTSPLTPEADQPHDAP